MDALIGQRLAALRKARGLSRRALSWRTVEQGSTGVSEATITSLEKRQGTVPQAWIIEALAQALDVRPESFYEYPIAKARAARAATCQEMEASTLEEQERDLEELAERERGNDEAGATGKRGARRTGPRR